MNVKRNLLIAGFVAAIVTLCATPAFAGANDQEVEWIDNPGSLRWSLTSIGQGWLVSGDLCDANDYVMRVNKNASADSDRYRIYSYNGTVQNGFYGTSPMGHNLNSTTPYLCLGFTDTWSGGGPLHVASHMFVWVQ